MLLLAPLLALSSAPPSHAAADAADFAWQPRPGASVPLATMFRDEDGAPVPLAQAFAAGKPVVLDLGYHRCPTLCGPVRADLLGALRTSGLPHTAFRLVVLSIDPAETPAIAATARRVDDAPPGSFYLTGTAPSIAAVADAVGFRSRWDAGLEQFLHPAGVVILTPDGRVSSTLLGVGYSADAVRADLVRAAGGGIAAAPSPILLLCFHFDQATGRYSLAITKVLRIMAVLTVLTIAGALWALHRA